MRKIVKLLTSKVLILGLLILLQLIFLFFFVHKLANDDLIGVYVHFVFIAASVLIVLHIVASNENPSYKIAWLIPVLAFPVFGTFFYILYHQNNVTNRSIRKYSSITKKRSDLLQGHPNYSKFKETNYYNANGWRDYKNTSSLLLDSGQIKLEHLLRDLKKAEKFIFMEYFIISKGKMLDEILDVLIERAHAGVEIKIIYDDFGSADRLPFNFRNKMSALGIETLPFNRMRPHINFSMNYRDHRKVIVIDNKIGYTGGINIGDEYANYYERFGKWHDASIRIEGNAVWSLTLLFLENWNFSTSKKQQVSFLDYYYSHSVESNDIVVPFGDSPMENKQLARNSFLYLINEAKEEILITTPYLIFDNELLTALKLAAASGVKVKIVIPKIPDKHLVYSVTESYALELLKSGIEIYKFTPGFIHSKLLVIDNTKAIIGTTNLDFRSLYLHFENNIYLYGSKTVNDIRKFINDTINESSLETELSLEKKGLMKLFQSILKGFASIL